PDPEFLREARRLCERYGTILILDEIQSGYGRSGKFFAHQHAGIAPDLITVAKGMGNGFPVAGVLIHPRFQAAPGLLGTTFGGSHLACAAALAVLEVIEQEGLIAHAAAMGRYLRDGLVALQPRLREVRGEGLMLGIDLGRPA
ncbi:MAG: aminotransferase class III-fold pyridoxal phosphate-dependent enzyme, partial [Calditrichaeota bacterium]|nr:aminotransferase class III-fold pyridoxal phosphate-dependent enzyme [Calditrichota bacterium]